MSGKISYTPAEAKAEPAPARSAHIPARPARTHTPPPGPLSGSVTVTSLRLSSDTLSKPIQVARMTIDPVSGQTSALSAAVPIAAGGPTPLAVTARLSLAGYQIGLHGGASLQRMRELAHIAGMADAGVLDKVEGQTAVVDLAADGPWLASAAPLAHIDMPGALPSPAPVLVAAASDHMAGTVTLHGVNWKADFLANPLEISAATLHLGDNGTRWDPVAFSYGPVSGTATLAFPTECEEADRCPPRFTVQFVSLDAAALQAALLGARQPGTLLSSLLARLHPASAAAWPEVEGSIRAGTLVLGPVTLSDASADLRTRPDGTEITTLDAALMGGRIHAEGSIVPGAKPDYSLKGKFTQANAVEFGRLLGMNWSGNAIDGDGQMEMAGFTGEDFASSAKGTVHFDWRHGAVEDEPGTDAPPPALTRFDRWTGDVEIANGAMTLTQNQVLRGGRKVSVEASATFGEPPKVTFSRAQDVRAAKR